MTQQYFDFTNDLIFRWVMEREENCLAIFTGAQDHDGQTAGE